MAIKGIFPPKGEMIETFDHSDVATGLGFENYWGTPSEDTAGVDYNLLPFQINSGNGRAVTLQAGAGTTTLPFDTSTFNLPRTAKGIAYVSFSQQNTIASAVSVKAQIAIVDSGGTPTNISSEIETALNGNTTVIPEILALPLTQTTIKKGEKIRLTMKVIVNATGGNGTLSHDNTESDIDKHLRLLMPFRIES